jgi:hypothetical protein
LSIIFFLMKQILRVSILLFVFFAGHSSLKATHITGGELTYEYIGNQANPFLYRVTVVQYATDRFSNFPMDNTIQICITSSCFPNQTHTLPAATGFTSPGEVLNTYNCSNVGSQSFPVIRMVYQADVSLIGKCADYRFQARAQCCRVDANNVTNILNYGPNSEPSLFVAQLNNTSSENNTPTFNAFPQVILCAGQRANMIQNVAESDGDSLHIEFTNIRSGGSACLSPSGVIEGVFAPGFQTDRPFVTQGSAPIAINQTNGNFSFEAGPIIGLYSYSITVDEYRLHPSGTFHYKVGSATRELMVNFVDCADPPILPDFLRRSLPGNPAHFSNAIFTNYRAFMLGYTPKDSISFAASPTGYAYPMPNVDYNCQDSVIELYLRRPIINLTADASQFFIVGPDTQAVVGEKLYFNHNAFSDTVYLKPSQPIRLNGQHFVVIIRDSLNPMLTVCGSEFLDTMVYSLRASNCPDNISVSNEIEMHLRPTISPNPTQDFISISNPSYRHLKFEIFDLRGSRYRTGEIYAFSENTFQTTDLPSGVYLVMFTDEQGRRITQKMIKQ